MTSRELRTHRAEERKARKQEREQLVPTQLIEEAQPRQETDPLPDIGFVSQNRAPEPDTAAHVGRKHGFVSQNLPQPHLPETLTMPQAA